MELVQFNEVTKKYNNQTIIDKLSFTLKSGENCALLGPSGCGKTTILNLTAGITNKTQGIFTATLMILVTYFKNQG
ncbi:ATP-binding cassette domain-containing protein [Anaerobacillus sp. HL2]|nr:ATP-binding cassette domain-containing protein [Anaerobacillus sp. HL2]